MTILDNIIANTCAEVAERRQRILLVELRARAEAAPPPRDFAAALQSEHIALIAEIKRASPSRGALHEGLDPAQAARTYAGHGACAISVLTDARYFGGSLDDLAAAREAVSIPVLRKDFVVDEYQLYESRAWQADAILLIVRVLSDSQLRDYLALAHTLGLSALAEVHDESDVARALQAGAHIIGINNRNLQDFVTDLRTTERLAPLIPPGTCIVAESGIATRADVERAGRAGAHAVLVGQALVQAKDVGAAVKELAGVKASWFK